MIEMMIVIAIIILLFGMFFLGANQIFGSNKVGLTKSILQTAVSLYSEYDQATHSVTNPPITYPQTPFYAPTPTPVGPTYVSIYEFAPAQIPSAINFWTAWGEVLPQQVSQNLTYNTGSPQVFPVGTYLPDGIVTQTYLQSKAAGALASYYPTPWAQLPKLSALSQSVQDTVSVMYVLSSIAANQKILAGLPPAEVSNAITYLGLPAPSTTLTPSDITLPLGPNATPTVVVNPPLMLDAWNNLVIFVPAQGLIGVKAPPNTPDNFIAGHTYQRGDRVIYGGIYYTWINTVSSNNVTQPSINPTPSAPHLMPDQTPYLHPGNNANWGGFCSTDFKPFFMSAGPDGDLSTGNDNVYSFQP